MTTTIEDLISTVNSVNVGAVSLSRKEAKTLAQNVTSDEAPLLLCIVAGGKIVLTTENLFLVESRLLRAAKVNTVPLIAIKSVQEKRGLLLAKINIITTGGAIKLSNLSKKASTKLIGFLQKHENITVLPVKKAGIIEITFKLAIVTFFAFIVKDTCVTSPVVKKESIQEENLNIATTGNGKIAIDLNTGKTVTSSPKIKSTPKQWFEGGTLHQATIKQWRKATPENKLATCADYLAYYWVRGQLRFSIADIDGLKPYAQELVDFIDTGTADVQDIEHRKVNEAATLGFYMMKWLKD